MDVQVQECEENNETTTQSSEKEPGSSVGGAIFNFTNCIIGAGAIGLGGAFAVSGGLVSIITILFFGILTKLSLDLVIELSLLGDEDDDENDEGSTRSSTHHGTSYEDLGRRVFGLPGQLVVLSFKFLYSFGCLVAYVIVVKDNFGPAVKSLIFGNVVNDQLMTDFLYNFLTHSVWSTWTVSLLIIFPLCLLRDMTPLASFSLVSIISMIVIVGIVFGLSFDSGIRHEGGSIQENWFQIRPGYLECLGTFVFTFVSQHTVHLTFSSLRPSLQTLENWKTISTWSIGMSCFVSLSVGVFSYATFWGDTESDLFEIYPSLAVIDLAKLLLCVTMLFTFPLPFFTCRELVVTLFVMFSGGDGNDDVQEQQQQQHVEVEGAQDMDGSDNLQEPLLSNNSSDEQEQETTQRSHFLIPGHDMQLVRNYHVVLTAILWLIATGLAVTAPSLGDVLDLVGCVSGTMIAFVIPASLSFKLQGYSHKAMMILLVGGVVGVVGTFYSFKKLISDVETTSKSEEII
jgi:amino acid permease